MKNIYLFIKSFIEHVSISNNDFQSRSAEVVTKNYSDMRKKNSKSGMVSYITQLERKNFQLGTF